MLLQSCGKNGLLLFLKSFKIPTKLAMVAMCQTGVGLTNHRLGPVTFKPFLFKRLTKQNSSSEGKSQGDSSCCSQHTRNREEDFHGNPRGKICVWGLNHNFIVHQEDMSKILSAGVSLLRASGLIQASPVSCYDARV